MKAVICDACRRAVPLPDFRNKPEYYQKRTMPMEWAKITIGETGVDDNNRDLPCLVLNQVCDTCLDAVRKILKPNG